MLNSTENVNLRLLLDLNPYGALTHWVCFILFFRELLMSWRLSVVFRRSFRLGSFPACWRQVKVTSNYERSAVLLSSQLPIDFHKISIVWGVLEYVVCLSRTKKKRKDFL